MGKDLTTTELIDLWVEYVRPHLREEQLTGFRMFLENKTPTPAPDGSATWEITGWTIGWGFYSAIVDRQRVIATGADVYYDTGYYFGLSCLFVHKMKEFEETVDYGTKN